jgi:hypothetical protein
VFTSIKHWLMLNSFLHTLWASITIELFDLPTILAASQYLPAVRAQMWRDFTETTPGKRSNDILTLSYSMYEGTPSSKIIMQSFTIKYVVKTTRIEKKNVQIGSIICQVGMI